MLEVRADGLGKTPQDALALPRFETPPGTALEARPRSSDRGIDIGRRAARHLGYGAAVDRAYVLEHAPIGGLHGAAVDHGTAFGLQGRREALPGAPVAPDGGGTHGVEASTVALAPAA